MTIYVPPGWLKVSKYEFDGRILASKLFCTKLAGNVVHVGRQQRSGVPLVWRIKGRLRQTRVPLGLWVDPVSDRGVSIR